MEDGLNAWQKHKKRVADYVKHYGDKRPPEAPVRPISDVDILMETYEFIPEDDSKGGEKGASYEARLAYDYYQRLFKEYCLADMSLYKLGKLGLRWRTEKEVIKGKGQFICGNIKCSDKDNLKSYEVLFGYREHGENKQNLVKIRLCDSCGYKLNYQKIKQYKKANKRKLQEENNHENDHLYKSEKKTKKKKKKRTNSSSNSDDD